MKGLVWFLSLSVFVDSLSSLPFRLWGALVSIRLCFACHFSKTRPVSDLCNVVHKSPELFETGKSVPRVLEGVKGVRVERRCLLSSSHLSSPPSPFLVSSMSFVLRQSELIGHVDFVLFIEMPPSRFGISRDHTHVLLVCLPRRRRRLTFVFSTVAVSRCVVVGPPSCLQPHIFLPPLTPPPFITREHIYAKARAKVEASPKFMWTLMTSRLNISFCMWRPLASGGRKGDCCFFSQVARQRGGGRGRAGSCCTRCPVNDDQDEEVEEDGTIDSPQNPLDNGI